MTKATATTTTSAVSIAAAAAASILSPNKAYLDVVKKESITLREPRQDQLLILDLNGTCVSRTKGNKSMYLRPYAQPLFDYIFDNFTVMVWSSAQSHSVKFMSRIFGSRQLDLVWDRNSFQLNKRDFNRKVTTIKDLDKVWRYYGNQFDATNTILLDDSPKKTVLQPYNAIHPTEFEHFSPTFTTNGESEFLQILQYLKKLKFQSNIANFIQRQPYQIDLQLFKEKNTFVLEYYVSTDDANKRPILVDFTPRITTTKKKVNDDDNDINDVMDLLRKVKI